MLGCTEPAAEPATPPVPFEVGPRAPVVAVLGDSFTVGSGPVRTWDSYAAWTARELGWHLVVAGAAGTGYVNTGRVGRDFQRSFMYELSWRPAPDLLIVSGGHNDRRLRPALVYFAAAKLLRTVRTHWPRTRIVVMGPIWMGYMPRWALSVRDAVALAAAKAKVTFLDPLERRWVTPHSAMGMLLPDGVHPTHQGHMRLARWLTDSLRTRGVT
ncbi:SGNH/GDSL hydrolase family protein [Sinosporangium siamense]